MSPAFAWRFAAVLAAILITSVAFAPATWLGDLLQAHGPFRLVHADGTVWRGSGLMAVSDGRQARLLPGRVAWQVEWSALLSGRLVLRVKHEAADRTVRVRLDGRTVVVEAGELSVPAALLAAAGAPFNTLKPGGTLHLQWDTVRVRGDGFEGKMQLDWKDAQSALSAVAPLGTYRLTVSGTGTRGEATLATLSGPLRIEGKGSMDHEGIRFNGLAEAQPEMRASLDGLIGLMGRRTRDQVLLNWEIRR